MLRCAVLCCEQARLLSFCETCRLALMVAQQAMQPADTTSAAGPAHSSSMARFSTGSSSSSGAGRSLQASSWMSSSSSGKAMDRLSARSSLEAPAAAGERVGKQWWLVCCSMYV